MLRISLLSSYSLDLIPKKVNSILPRSGIQAQWYVAPFNQYRQELLNPSSPIKKFKPNIIVVSISTVDFIDDKEAVFKLIEESGKKFPNATLLIFNCIQQEFSPLRFLEWNNHSSTRLAIVKLNCQLADLAQKISNLYIFDIDSLFFKYGYKQMLDFRLYYIAKLPFSDFGMDKIAERLVEAFSAIIGKRKKCLVLDLDNTLWGGIVSEDGMEYIKLDNDGEGKAFYDFQKAIKKLRQSGILLAIASKNDEAIALDTIRNHPYMVLKEDDFAAMRINWGNKVENIQAIAQELNIGLDSFVYLDDSVFEREQIRARLPEVIVPDLPPDFTDYPMFLSDLPYFETFSITTEDIKRNQMYLQDRKRREFKQTNKTLDNFLNSLRTEVWIHEADQFSIPRVGQLTQKTNQFNLTTRRYSEADIQGFVQNSSWKVLCLSASDKFGDLGTVGVAIIEFSKDQARLDVFLMSCRVLGRGIEEAFLSSILSEAKKKGLNKVKAEYIPTKKNIMAKDFLKNNNFIFHNSHWQINLVKNISYPKWIKVNYGKKRKN